MFESIRSGAKNFIRNVAKNIALKAISEFSSVEKEVDQMDKSTLGIILQKPTSSHTANNTAIQDEYRDNLSLGSIILLQTVMKMLTLEQQVQLALILDEISSRKEGMLGYELESMAVYIGRILVRKGVEFNPK